MQQCRLCIGNVENILTNIEYTGKSAANALIGGNGGRRSAPGILAACPRFVRSFDREAESVVSACDRSSVNRNSVVGSAAPNGGKSSRRTEGRKPTARFGCRTTLQPPPSSIIAMFQLLYRRIQPKYQFRLLIQKIIFSYHSNGGKTFLSFNRS